MHKLLICLLSFLCTGCLKVNTSPMKSFCDVEEDVLERTGHCIYWDTSLDERRMRAYVDEALACELTPESVVYIALFNNKELQAIYEELGIAKAQLVQAGLLRNPVLDFQYRFPTQPGVTSLIDIGLFQNFLETLLIPLKKRSAAMELEATKERVIAQVLDVIGRTQIAFYEVQALENIWGMKKQMLFAAECAYEAAERMFEAGNMIALEVSDKRAFYEQMKIELSDLEIELFDARERINVLMGLWGDQIYWSVTPCLPQVQDCEWNNVESIAIANSVDLRMEKAHIFATAAGMGVDTARIVFPAFDVGVSSEREDSIWYVGPAFALAIPFFDFGQANSAAAQSEIFRQWNLYTALAIKIRSAARLSRLKTLNAERQIAYYDNILVPLAKRITSQTLLQHNAMQLGVFELLDAKMNELGKEIEAIEFQKEYWIARTELETLLTGHWLQNEMM